MPLPIPFPRGPLKPRWKLPSFKEIRQTILSRPSGVSTFANQRGQLAVEYVLLLIVAVGIAFLIRTALVKGGDSPEDSGAVLQKWNQMGKAIGSDDPNHRK